MVRHTVPWSREGLFYHIIEFIVTHDEVGGWRIGCMTTHPWQRDNQVGLLACLLACFLSLSHSVSLTAPLFAPFSNFIGRVQKRRIFRIA